jgi:hypothetical protein
MRALLASTALSLLAAPALAQTPCAEQIATIERRLNSEGAVAVTGATSPPAQAPVEGSPKAVPAPAGTSSTDAPAPTRERIAAARAAIEKARGFDRQGNTQACNDAMTEAKQLIGPLP